MTEVGPIPGFIDLDLSLLLHQPLAKVRAAWWSGSGLSVIQALGESTLFSGKKTSIRREFFGFCWRKPRCQVTTNCSTHCDLIPLLRKTVLNHLYSYNNGHWPCLIFHFKHKLLIIGPSQVSWSITYCSLWNVTCIASQPLWHSQADWLLRISLAVLRSSPPPSTGLRSSSKLRCRAHPRLGHQIDLESNDKAGLAWSGFSTEPRKRS